MIPSLMLLSDLICHSNVETNGRRSDHLGEDDSLSNNPGNKNIFLPHVST